MEKGVIVLPYKSENGACDAIGYGQSRYQRRGVLTDANVLYEAYLKALKGTRWKPSVQRFEEDFLYKIAVMQQQICDGTYQYSDGVHFTVCERGRKRPIVGEIIDDRIVNKAICDSVITPAIQPHLMYDNSASQKGKGTDFARRRLVEHLLQYYREHGSSGFIGLFDLSKFYDNIRHADFIRVLKMFGVNDECALQMIKKSLDRERVDVSMLSEQEIQKLWFGIFNSLEYNQKPEEMTGTRMMPKHMNLGDQISQTAGIVIPAEIDSYIKIVRGMKYYGRYCDDGYVISNSKEELEDIFKNVIRIAATYGLHINQKKTRIVKLSSNWRYLQTMYSLHKNGSIMQKVNPKRLTRFRRKAKKLIQKKDHDAFVTWYVSNYRSMCKYLSRKQKANIKRLFKELTKGEDLNEYLHIEIRRRVNINELLIER